MCLHYSSCHVVSLTWSSCYHVHRFPIHPQRSIRNVNECKKLVGTCGLLRLRIRKGVVGCGIIAAGRRISGSGRAWRTRSRCRVYSRWLHLHALSRLSRRRLTMKNYLEALSNAGTKSRWGVWFLPLRSQNGLRPPFDLEALQNPNIGRLLVPCNQGLDCCIAGFTPYLS